MLIRGMNAKYNHKCGVKILVIIVCMHSLQQLFLTFLVLVLDNKRVCVMNGWFWKIISLATRLNISHVDNW